MHCRKRSLCIFCVLFLMGTLLVACNEGPIMKAPARCTVGDHMRHDDLQGNAGCLIKIDGRAVLINEGWSFSPPGGGFRKIEGQKEAAWQTACRETQEEVWIAPLKVERLLHSFGKYHLFECTFDAKTTRNFKAVKSFVKKDADKANLNSIKVVLKDPKDVPERKWRYPEHRSIIIDLFNKLPSAGGK